MQTLREEAIIQLVRAKLGENRETYGQTIDVHVVDGDIFLIGWCDTEEARLTAIRIAKGTYGVRTVIDNIRVRTIRYSL